MAQPKQILDRRETVRNIHKITRTMEMISTGRYRQFQQRVLDVRAYTDALIGIVQNVLEDARRETPHPLLRENAPTGREALVVLTSNRGLCGGYNAGVLRLLNEARGRLADQGRGADVYVVGRKGRIYCRMNGIEPVWSAEQFERSIDVDAVDALATKLIEGYLSERYSAVRIAHATFISASVQRPMMPALLPLGQPQRLPSDPQRDRGRDQGASSYEYLPDPETILDALLPRTVSLKLLQAFLDAVLSEHVARMTAMHLASENAGEMIKSLTMQYNRARQGAITTELAEIVTGVEAMK